MERKQLEAAAASNHYLRGLLAIPFGMVLIASGLGNMEWGPFRELWTVPVAIVLAGGLYLLGVRYYNDHYGRVTLRTGRMRNIPTLATIGAVAMMIGGPILVQALDLPLNGFGIAWATVALGFYAVTVGLRLHHVVIWGAVLVASLVPLWGDPSTSDTPNIGLLIIGAAAIVTGLLDHRLLVRTFGSPADVDLEDSHAAT
ncbi:MAG: hypothetical protein QOH36_812 [Actinomycetota bacterium]|jgi:hypothetical protein|nr:hypothetical protein [Actinomycetota bacterium]MEA2973096.1 hypothetical protein [Actinomycetota bacterium]